MQVASCKMAYFSRIENIHIDFCSILFFSWLYSIPSSALEYTTKSFVATGKKESLQKFY